MIPPHGIGQSRNRIVVRQVTCVRARGVTGFADRRGSRLGFLQRAVDEDQGRTTVGERLGYDLAQLTIAANTREKNDCPGEHQCLLVNVAVDPEANDGAYRAPGPEPNPTLA